MVNDDALNFVDQKAKELSTKPSEDQQKQQSQSTEVTSTQQTGEDDTDKKPTQPEEESKGTEEEKENTDGAGDERKYRVVVVDINNTSKTERLNPPREFIEAEFLKKLRVILADGGLLIYNIISPDKSNMESVLSDIHKVFDIIYTAQPEGEMNTVVYAINYRFPRQVKEQTKEELMMVEESKLHNRKSLEVGFKALSKLMKKQWDVTMNLETYSAEIALKYPAVYSNPFQKSNAYVEGKDAEATNKTKEMYLDDLEKVNKSKRRKKKNKIR